MKKFILAAATLALLSTASFANKEDSARTMRIDFMKHTQKMINDEMAMIKHLNGMLTAYQAQLKLMMQNEMGRNSNH